MLSDDKIVDLYWQRDERAIEHTDEKYGTYCLAIAKRILDSQEDAEECINDTWLRTWHRLPPEKPVFLRAFLAKIIRNLSLDCYRLQHAAKRGGGEMAVALDELGECVSGQESIESQLEKQELELAVKNFVHRLPNPQKNVFIRRYFFLESHMEIAERYHLSEGNVRKILSRTRVKLKAHLIKEGFNL